MIPFRTIPSEATTRKTSGTARLANLNPGQHRQEISRDKRRRSLFKMPDDIHHVEIILTAARHDGGAPTICVIAARMVWRPAGSVIRRRDSSVRCSPWVRA
jgi:hypothetical protein